MLQNLLAAAVMIGALRVNILMKKKEMKFRARICCKILVAVKELINDT